jgi:hypothetical protein
MRMLTAIASTLLVVTAEAQDSDRAAPPPDPLFHVELIVFTYNDGNRGEEDFRHGHQLVEAGPVPELLRVPAIDLETVFDIGRGAIPPLGGPPDAPARPEAAVTDSGAGGSVNAADDPAPGDEPALGDGLELIEREPPAARPGAAAAALPDGFRMLAPAELELTEARARLSRLRPYRVLGHVGWAQSGVDTDRSVAIDLKQLGLANPVGTVEVYLRRFLHVALDLELYDGSGTRWTAPPGFGLAAFEYAASYRLSTERNAIRSTELHYIDHPLFGVLIRITPAPEPAEPGAAGAGGPAG